MEHTYSSPPRLRERQLMQKARGQPSESQAMSSPPSAHLQDHGCQRCPEARSGGTATARNILLTLKGEQRGGKVGWSWGVCRNTYPTGRRDGKLLCHRWRQDCTRWHAAAKV